jgi:psp operon transcriptional activator
VGSQFVDRAREAAAFRRNLLLIGPPGTLFEEIAVDIIAISGRSEHCVTLKPGQVSDEKLQGFFTGEYAQRNLVLILEDAEKLTPQEVDSLIRMADEKGGINGILRLVFCLKQTVEELYDAGSIDEEFYLFLGSNELKIPELKGMPEDLVAMARRQIDDECEEARFDMKMRSALLDHDWPENMLELRSVIIRAINLAQPMPPQARHIEAALEKDPEGGSASEDQGTTLERFLKQEKARYLAAVDQLLNF